MKHWSLRFTNSNGWKFRRFSRQLFEITAHDKTKKRAKICISNVVDCKVRLLLAPAILCYSLHLSSEMSCRIKLTAHFLSECLSLIVLNHSAWSSSMPTLLRLVSESMSLDMAVKKGKWAKKIWQAVKLENWWCRLPFSPHHYRYKNILMPLASRRLTYRRCSKSFRKTSTRLLCGNFIVLFLVKIFLIAQSDMV